MWSFVVVYCKFEASGYQLNKPTTNRYHGS